MRFGHKKRLILFRVPPYRKRLMASLITLGILLLTAAVGFYMVDARIRPALMELAVARARQIANEAVNTEIHHTLIPQIQYDKLIKTDMDATGKVTLLQPNNSEISRIYSIATLNIQARLKNLPKEEFKIPFGQVMGTKLFAEMGPEILVRIIPVGLVETSLHDTLDAAGINQVRHRIFITVKATIRVAVPAMGELTTVSTTIPLTEAIIVGAVPDVYVGNGGIIMRGEK